MVIMHLMFTTCRFETNIPWASLDRYLSLYKVLLRFFLSVAFIFDKAGD